MHGTGLDLYQILAYWTDCAIATYSQAVLRKSSSKSDKDRFQSIAKEMLNDLRLHTPPGHEEGDPGAHHHRRSTYAECVKRMEGAEKDRLDEEGLAKKNKIPPNPDRA
jgi:hypothetical protein